MDFDNGKRKKMEKTKENGPAFYGEMINMGKEKSMGRKVHGF
jgi:hypothetical protein